VYHANAVVYLLPFYFYLDVVGVPGLEPGTSILSGSRSNQLSYTPVLTLNQQKSE
jgi:hypothetical protein